MRNKGGNQGATSPEQRYHLRLAGGAAAWFAAATLHVISVVKVRKGPRSCRCRAWTPSTAHPLGRRWYCCFRSTTLARRRALLASILVVASHIPTFAQGCASCYTTTAAGGSQTINALRSGILVLLVPSLVLFLSIIFVLARWRRIRSASADPITGMRGAE